MTDLLENFKIAFADQPELIAALEGLLQGLQDRDKLIENFIAILEQQKAERAELEATGRCPTCGAFRLEVLSKPN
jgi:hypothetical protein